MTSMWPGCGNSGPERGCCSSLDELLLDVVFNDGFPPLPLDKTDELPRGLLPNAVLFEAFTFPDALLLVGTSYSTAVPSINRDLRIE